MTERRDIGARLENWAKVYRPERASGVSPTALFCDQLKREVQGEGAGGERRKNDEADAQRIEWAMRLISHRDRKLLTLCYIDQREPHVVCRKLSIPHRPPAAFVAAFRAAQAAIEAAAEGAENFHDA